MNPDGDRIRVFVVHWNQPMACAATVRAIIDQHVPVKVTILDNNSAPDAFETLRTHLDPAIEIVRLPQNKGWGPALNVALRTWLQSAEGQFCLISAHDAALSPDCIPLLVQAAQANGRIGIACPQYDDATMPHLTALHGVRVDVDLAQSAGTTAFVDVPHGTLMLIRRECLAEIGLFDERYFAYGDEHELGARAVRRGWKVALVWGAVVRNPGTSTPSLWRSYLFTRNSLLLVRDYYGPIAACLRAAILLANTLRRRDDGLAFSAKARVQGICDYFRGRFGPPRFE
jgi:GT2 family glycosyltransferase